MTNESAISNIKEHSGTSIPEIDELSKKLSRLISFGAKILDWEIKEGRRTDEDIAIILFLRNFLAEIDGVSVLIGQSAVDPCKKMVRTALENFFSVEYILQGDSARRSLSFIVWDALVKRKLLVKFSGTSNTYKDTAAKFSQDKIMKTSKPYINANAEQEIKLIDEMLKLPQYALIMQEFDGKDIDGKIPAWYSFFGGPPNLEQLADRIGYPALYDQLYRGWSPSSHGNDILAGKLLTSPKGNIELLNFRDPKDAGTITMHCANIGALLFKNFIAKRWPAKINEWQQWYVSIRA